MSVGIGTATAAANALAWHGEQGDQEDWPAWRERAVEARAAVVAAGEAYALEALRQRMTDPDGWAVLGAANAAAERLDGAIAARTPGAWAWPTWAGAR